MLLLHSFGKSIVEAGLHGESDGLLAILWIGEVAVTDDFHTDNAVVVLPHDFYLLKHWRQMRIVALGVPRLGRRVYVSALRIDPHEVDVHPVQLSRPGQGRQRE